MSDNNNNVTLTIDGQLVSVPRGTTVLAAAKSIGIEIPTFCWHPKLKPAGSCRICYVEIEKARTLMVSCATEVAPDMVVYTASEKVLQGRKAVLEFILANHPLDCPTCDKGGECDLQNLTFEHGVDDSRFDFKKYRHIRDKNSTFDDLKIGPEIIRNQNRCLLCYKCVRANKEIFGEDDLGAFQRGNITEINTPPGEQVDSLYSGNLVEICPVGALTSNDWRYKIRVWNTQTVDSICPYCADGCNLTVWKNRQKVYRATSRRNDRIDEGWICDVGRYGYQVSMTEDRLTTPLIKKGESQVPATWEEALGLIGEKLKKIKDGRGGVCIGGLISPNLDSLSMYAFSKFFRKVLNSNNVDFRAGYKMLPEKPDDLYSKLTSVAFKIADIEKSDLILILDSDLTKEHPIVNLRVRKAVTQKNTALYMLNPITTQTGSLATDEMVYNIGALHALLNGICISLIDQNLTQYNNAGELKEMLSPNTVEEASRISGIDVERINSLANTIGQAKNISLLAGELLTGSVDREKLSGAIINLSLLSGIFNDGQVGLLSQAANSKGAEKLGVMPHQSEKSILTLKQVWERYPDSEGLALDQMIRSSIKEELDSMLIVGSNLLLEYPDGTVVKEGLEKLDFLIVADICETETTQMADVVLPISSWLEYDSSFVNLGGVEQKFNAAIKPIGFSLPAYQMINKIASEFKTSLFETVDDLKSEVETLMQSDPDRHSFDLCNVEYIEEKRNPEFDIPLLIANERHHFGHLTEKSNSLSAFCSEAFLEISPSLAEKLRVNDGSIIRVESEVGKINLPVKISEFIENDVVMAYRNFSTNPVNILQMRKRNVDRVKLTAVEGT
ncbi:MAG: NADH dehydrogenase (quinone) subunit G [Candidatus Zixiibacteriota bacterium]|nr:MAG: NADH dehydrogenase (quinone) subunit G [candidate division Zixibacteria bacterium]